MDYAQFISQVGFPVAVAFYFVIQNGKQTDKYIELAKQASLDSRASTEAIEQSSKIIERNTTAFDRNTEAFNKLSGALDAKK